jgi:hypothetical protein
MSIYFFIKKDEHFALFMQAVPHTGSLIELQKAGTKTINYNYKLLPAYLRSRDEFPISS